MTEKLEEQIKKLPDTPGVYFFKSGKVILYIGKATSLRSRVRSYFHGDINDTRSPWIGQMISRVDDISYEKTDSVLEALILESQEIKKYLPPYNTREKDNKSFLFVGISKEEFPCIITLRGSELKLHANSYKLKAIYGPFAYPSELREALKIIRKIFPFRDRCVPNSGKPCFNAQIGLCSGVCAGWVTKQEYLKIIRNLSLFFQGRKARVIKNLEKEMKELAREQKFEQAGEIKRKIFALQHIQDVALIKHFNFTEAGLLSRSPASGRFNKFRIEAYDIAHLSGQHTVGAMVAMQNGELDKKNYRKFKLKGKSAEKSDDVANLKEILERRFNHLEWALPDLIVVDGGQAQINAAKMILKNRGLKIPVVGVVKDEHHRAREIIGGREHFRDLVRLNQEAHRFAVAYHRQRRDRVV